MKPLMHTMRQLHQRRINAFFFSDPENHSPPSSYPSYTSQLSLQYVPRQQDRARSHRDMFADQEYDNDDDAH